MRSRYSAYLLGREDYLLATWHASTRPDALHLSAEHQAPVWLGLEVHTVGSVDQDRATVEFVAHYRLGGSHALRLHEVSRFVCEAGRAFHQ